MQLNVVKKIRVDKWLWNVRIFKSRTKATDSCKSGKIKINDLNIKPSYLIEAGEIIQVRKDGFDLIFKAVELIDRRVNATLAAPCYENLTSEDELNKYKDWYIGKAAPERRERGAGRPTKRDRRTLDEFKDDIYNT